MEVKVCDFGLAAQLTGAGEKKHTTCGTPNYLAPEVFDKANGYSKQVDVWALGVMTYTMLYGRPPFEHTEVKEIYKRIKSLDYSFPDKVEVSESARDLIKKILIKDPT